MILKENDTIISTNDINENILKGTVGVILNILEKNKYFLVEFHLQCINFYTKTYN